MFLLVKCRSGYNAKTELTIENTIARSAQNEPLGRCLAR